jgi:hypothetical protein
VRLAVAAIITGVPLSLPQIAIAQDSGADEELTEVTVTGTRIVRRDVVANSRWSPSTVPQSSSAPV